MSFIEKNWILILVMFLSGAMLIWPIIQRRFSPVKEVGNLNVTHLINHKNAVLLDIRESKEFTGGKLPDAVQAASAIAINADALVTHDRDFSRLRAVRVLM